MDDSKLIKLTMRNYQMLFKHSDKLIRYGNNYYLDNYKYNECSNLVPKPLPNYSKYGNYKNFKIKF